MLTFEPQVQAQENDYYLFVTVSTPKIKFRETTQIVGTIDSTLQHQTQMHDAGIALHFVRARSVYRSRRLLLDWGMVECI